MANSIRERSKCYQWVITNYLQIAPPCIVLQFAERKSLVDK